MQLIDSLIKPIFEWGIREELLHGDHTGQNLWEPGDTATAQVYAKQGGIVAGLPVARMTWQLLDPDCDVESLTEDGAPCEPGDVLMRITGASWIFGAGERLALDYLQHLSGIATRAHHYVKLVEPYGVGITDFGGSRLLASCGMHDAAHSLHDVVVGPSLVQRAILTESGY